MVGLLGRFWRVLDWFWTPDGHQMDTNLSAHARRQQRLAMVLSAKPMRDTRQTQLRTVVLA
jgi:hypothetical protein